jgi:hypothetical protein
MIVTVVVMAIVAMMAVGVTVFAMDVMSAMFVPIPPSPVMAAAMAMPMTMSERIEYPIAVAPGPAGPVGAAIGVIVAIIV